MGSIRALLVIADIGGYTKFMRVHRINLAHAQYIVAQLLEAVIDGAEPKLTLAKLEGDAAFFYAVLPDDPKKPDRRDHIADLATLVASMRQRFLERQVDLETLRMCTCDSCVQAGKLKLKFVAHAGEVAFQKVRRLKELAGVDVIFVHRLLKNSVPISEYALMSEPVFEGIDASMRPFGRETTEELEGLGRVKTYYIDLVDITRERPIPPRVTLWRRLAAWLKMTLGSIPYFVGVRKSCDGFRNMGGVDPSLALPASTDRPSAVGTEL
jgi:hypothetical protein